MALGAWNVTLRFSMFIIWTFLLSNREHTPPIYTKASSEFEHSEVEIEFEQLIITQKNVADAITSRVLHANAWLKPISYLLQSKFLGHCVPGDRQWEIPNKGGLQSAGQHWYVLTLTWEPGKDLPLSRLVPRLQSGGFLPGLLRNTLHSLPCYTPFYPSLRIQQQTRLLQQAFANTQCSFTTPSPSWKGSFQPLLEVMCKSLPWHVTFHIANDTIFTSTQTLLSSQIEALCSQNLMKALALMIHVYRTTHTQLDCPS